MAKTKEAPSEEIPNLTPPDDSAIVDPPVVDSPPKVEKPSIDESAAALRAEFETLNRQALSENASELQRLRQENEAYRNGTIDPAKKPDTFSEFMEKPRSALREELEAVVAPLMEFKNEFTRDRKYNALISGLANSPQLQKLYNQVKPYVDQMMSTQDPTPANLQAMIISAYGARAAGLLGSTDPEPTPNPTPRAKVDDPTPPHIPPSAPAAPRKAGKGADPIDALVEQLTETERKVARLQGFSDLRLYVQYRDAESDVGTWGGIK